jgi:hypothetical protein
MAALALLNELLELRPLFRGQNVEGFLMRTFHRRFDLRAQRLSAGLIFGAELTLIILTQVTQCIMLRLRACHRALLYPAYLFSLRVRQVKFPEQSHRAMTALSWTATPFASALGHGSSGAILLRRHRLLRECHCAKHQAQTKSQTGPSKYPLKRHCFNHSLK